MIMSTKDDNDDEEKRDNNSGTVTKITVTKITMTMTNMTMQNRIMDYGLWIMFAGNDGYINWMMMRLES